MEITRKGESSSKNIVTLQLWRKSGSCSKGTIPVRRVQKKDQLHSPSMKEYGRKKLPRFSPLFKHLDDDDDYSSLTSQENHSLAVLQVEASSYSGAQGTIKSFFTVDDKVYPFRVNLSLYGDKQTRLFTYWTANSSNISSGYFDLTCSGFVQTNSETALAAALYPISVPRRAAHDIDIRIFKDPDTGNWWVIFQEKISLGYWPADLFALLKNQAGLVFWGGDVNSPNVSDRHPHTATEMGCGYLPPPWTDY
ncbi:hypothetical protein Vadar_014360 [Vaccinium darrowii]|uniref:Uncharacterized protein n=1 Tax=Vaccinium darrowii TaxID=229202 RepID=A0ACB7ZKC1_9ERIC|nr:hypothetical protein Vadar_014360 [Vaccinium darrowii]